MPAYTHTHTRVKQFTNQGKKAEAREKKNKKRRQKEKRKKNSILLKSIFSYCIRALFIHTFYPFNHFFNSFIHSFCFFFHSFLLIIIIRRYSFEYIPMKRKELGKKEEERKWIWFSCALARGRLVYRRQEFQTKASISNEKRKTGSFFPFLSFCLI